MGIGGIGPGSLLIILLIVILLFGTKKFRNIGSDLGSAFKNFRKAVKGKDDGGVSGDKDQDQQDQIEQAESGEVIEGEVTKEKDKV